MENELNVRNILTQDEFREKYPNINKLKLSELRTLKSSYITNYNSCIKGYGDDFFKDEFILNLLSIDEEEFTKYYKNESKIQFSGTSFVDLPHLSVNMCEDGLIISTDDETGKLINHSRKLYDYSSNEIYDGNWFRYTDNLIKSELSEFKCIYNRQRHYLSFKILLIKDEDETERREDLDTLSNLFKSEVREEPLNNVNDALQYFGIDLVCLSKTELNKVFIEKIKSIQPLTADEIKSDLNSNAYNDITKAITYKNILESYINRNNNSIIM